MRPRHLPPRCGGAKQLREELRMSEHHNEGAKQASSSTVTIIARPAGPAGRTPWQGDRGERAVGVLQRKSDGTEVISVRVPTAIKAKLVEMR